MIKLILTDIEGTIASISFVKDVLFPFARKNLAGFIREHALDTEVLKIISEVEDACGKKMTEKEVIETLTLWIDEDKKITPLKTLQGLIWEDGFKRGAFKAHIYPDALKKLQLWKDLGLPLYVYSSGSIFAQRLFFTYSEEGNILSLFSGHFDTTIGNKKEAASYERIAQATNTPAGVILFLSDIEEELDAAADAGMKTLLISRDNKIVHHGGHKTFSDFSDINLENIFQK